MNTAMKALLVVMAIVVLIAAQAMPEEFKVVVLEEDSSVEQKKNSGSSDETNPRSKKPVIKKIVIHRKLLLVEETEGEPCSNFDCDTPGSNECPTDIGNGCHCPLPEDYDPNDPATVECADGLPPSGPCSSYHCFTPGSTHECPTYCHCPAEQEENHPDGHIECADGPPPPVRYPCSGYPCYIPGSTDECPFTHCHCPAEENRLPNDLGGYIQCADGQGNGGCPINRRRVMIDDPTAC